MPVLFWSLTLMLSDHGSPPAMAFLSFVSLRISIPFSSHTSAMWKRYEGVPAIAVTGRSHISSICLFVFPVLIGSTVTPILVAASCTPIPPVNSPYPWAFCSISALVIPKETIPLSNDSAQFSRSFLVYPTTVGLPVVPDETCILTNSSYGLTNSLSG